MYILQFNAFSRERVSVWTATIYIHMIIIHKRSRRIKLKESQFNIKHKTTRQSSYCSCTIDGCLGDQLYASQQKGLFGITGACSHVTHISMRTTVVMIWAAHGVRHRTASVFTICTQATGVPVWAVMISSAINFPEAQVRNTCPVRAACVTSWATVLSITTASRIWHGTTPIAPLIILATCVSLRDSTPH